MTAMLYSLTGELKLKKENLLVLGVGGIAFRISAANRLIQQLPDLGKSLTLYAHLHVREDALDLYGFGTPEELKFFEMLISISGVGPKSALSILDVAELQSVAAAIQEGRPDLLTRASGIGRKTAERIVLELRNKVSANKSEATVRKMEADSDLLETLASLGYRREEAKNALEKVGHEVAGIEARLKAALQLLAKRK